MPGSEPAESPEEGGLPESTRRLVRESVVHANDGIVATAGIVEGFYGAGASGAAIVIAAFSAMIAGGISVGGATYSEHAAERDAQSALIEAERRRLELAPDEEFAELVGIYQKKGLSDWLAREVAHELTARDALAAHADAEYGLSVTEGRPSPLGVAVLAGLAFAAGAAVPLMTVIIAPNSWRIPVTFIAVIVSLTITSLIVAAAGGLHVFRTIMRTVAIGVTAMVATLLAGHLFHP